MANGENYNWEIMKNVGQLKAISVPCCCWQVWGSYTDFLLFSSPFFKSRELNKWVSRRRRDAEYVPRYHENDKAPVMTGWQQFTGSTAAGRDPSERNSQHPRARSLGVRPPSALPTFVYSRGSIVAPASTPHSPSPPLRGGNWVSAKAWVPGAKDYPDSHIHHL